ncbi:MAG: hypothetical protein RL659_1073, partial [Pseudomonadota bacterium]
VHGSGARSVASGSLVSRRSVGETLSTVSRPSPAVQQVPSDEKIAKSVNTLIALGEKQMKMAASVGTNSINIVNNNPISTRSASLPPQRTFLRKGARKEPSALHNMNSATKPPTGSIGSEALRTTLWSAQAPSSEASRSPNVSPVTDKVSKCSSGFNSRSKALIPPAA